MNEEQHKKADILRRRIDNLSSDLDYLEKNKNYKLGIHLFRVDSGYIEPSNHMSEDERLIFITLVHQILKNKLEILKEEYEAL